MATEIQEMPEQGEIVLATVTKVMDHGAYVTLDEYDEIQGFLHISEIAPGWIRSINRFVKENEKKVLLVKKVNTKRGDIDLSLKQVSKDQKRRKLKEVKKYEKGKTLLKNVQDKTDLSDDPINPGKIDTFVAGIFAGMANRTGDKTGMKIQNRPHLFLLTVGVRPMACQAKRRIGLRLGNILVNHVKMPAGHRPILI